MTVSDTTANLFRSLDRALGSYLSLEQIKSVYLALQTPPATTSLRVNTLKLDSAIAKDTLNQLLKASARNYPFSCQHFLTRDLLVIEALAGTTSDGGLLSRGPEVIVSLDCAKSFLRGANVFVGGVVAIEDYRATRPEIGTLVSLFVDMDGKCTRGLRKPYLGNKHFIGNGTLNMARDEIFMASTGIAIEQSSLTCSLPSFSDIDQSIFFPQNIPSIIAVNSLFATVDLRLVNENFAALDMCASPGGKSCHLAAKMNNSGLLVSADKNQNKLLKLAANLTASNAKCAKVVLMDASRGCSLEAGLDPWQIVSEATSHLAMPIQFKPESFDLIVLDPPCSGIGQRPTFFWEAVRSDDSIAIYQEKMFAVAVQLLKPGGNLLYSTCTLLPRENEILVANMLDKHPNIHLCDPKCETGSVGLLNCGLDEQSRLLVRRFWPDDKLDTIGFFFAIFKKDCTK